ncbi:MAG: DNA-directed RNA polymerase subunit omega [Terracidiphilus sp.]|jgi:hypothetical protein
MRSDSIFKNLEAGQNRFELCHQAFKAVRMLHNPGNRIQDTTNDALHRLADVAHEEIPVESKPGVITVTQVPVAIAPQLENVAAETSNLSIRANL